MTAPPRHPLHTLPLLLLLIPAFLLNWPIGWLCSYTTPARTSAARSILTESSTWPSWVPGDWPPLQSFTSPERLAASREQRYLAVTDLLITLQDKRLPPRDVTLDSCSTPFSSSTFAYAVVDGGSTFTFIQNAFGFPFHAVFYGDNASTYQGKISSNSIDPIQFVLFRHALSLPAGILLGPAILNTLVYTVFLALLVVLIRRTIRRRRLAHNLCTSCTYPLPPTSPRCPECGALNASLLHPHTPTPPHPQSLRPPKHPPNQPPPTPPLFLPYLTP